MDTPEVIEEGMSLWAVELADGRIIETNMPFKVSHVGKREIIGVDTEGNNRVFDISKFSFTK